MTEPSEKELERRRKIGAGMVLARSERHWSSGDGSIAREVKLDKAKEFAERIRPVIAEIEADLEQPTHRQIAEELNRRGVAASRGGAWSPKQVARLRTGQK